MTINLPRLFETGYLTEAIAGMSEHDIVSSIGMFKNYEDQLPFKDENGADVYYKKLIYEDIEFRCYNSAVEALVILFDGITRTKRLQIVGYEECQKRSIVEWRESLELQSWFVYEERSYLDSLSFIFCKEDSEYHLKRYLDLWFNESSNCVRSIHLGGKVLKAQYQV